MTKKKRPTAKPQTMTIRVAASEVELVRACATVMDTSIVDVLMVGAIALGADASHRWSGPQPPEVKRLVAAYRQVERERLGQIGPDDVRRAMSVGLRPAAKAVAGEVIDMAAEQRAGEDARDN